MSAGRRGDRRLLEAGRTVSVVGVRGGRTVTQRLASLGIVPGAELTVLRSHGPALIRLGRARIALGEGALDAIELEPLP